DEAARTLAAETLCDLDSFVDCHLGGHLAIIVDKLIDCKTKQILIDRGHLLDRPSRRGASDLSVNLRSVADDTFDETPRVGVDVALRRLLIAQANDYLERVVTDQIPFEQRLQGEYACASTRALRQRIV